MGYIKEKKLTKHVCQLGNLSLQMGICPSSRYYLNLCGCINLRVLGISTVHFDFQVSGELSNDGQPMRRFMQTFVLAPGEVSTNI